VATHELTDGQTESDYHCGVDLKDEKAFADAKAALCKTALLSNPQQGWELALMVDASSDCVGAALPSLHGSPWLSFSKKLEPAKVWYSAVDQDLLACCGRICNFRYMLKELPFTIYTDH
jgi:hypothetical protein